MLARSVGAVAITVTGPRDVNMCLLPIPAVFFTDGVNGCAECFIAFALQLVEFRFGRLVIHGRLRQVSAIVPPSMFQLAHGGGGVLLRAGVIVVFDGLDDMGVLAV